MVSPTDRAAATRTPALRVGFDATEVLPRDSELDGASSPDRSLGVYRGKDRAGRAILCARRAAGGLKFLWEPRKRAALRAAAPAARASRTARLRFVPSPSSTAAVWFLLVSACAPVAPGTTWFESKTVSAPAEPPEVWPPCGPLAEWSRPRPIIKRGQRDQHVRAPVLLVGDTSSYLVGMSDGAETDTTGGPALVVLRVDGSSVGRPPGAFRFAYPRAITDGHGRLHLLWAEPDSANRHTPIAMVRSHLTTLWHAKYDGMHWSLPERLYTGTALRWGDQLMDMPTVVGATVLQFVVIDGAPAADLLVQVSFSGGVWSTRALPAPARRVAYASSAVAADSVLVVAYMAGDPKRPGDVNSLFTARRNRDDRGWDVPLLVVSAGPTGAQEPVLRAAPSRALQLLWEQGLTEQQSAQVVRRATSADGFAWQLQPDLVPDGSRIFGLQVVVDGCERVHAAGTVARSGGGFAVEYFLVTSDSQDQRQSLSSEADAWDVALSQGADGALHAVWAERVAGAPRQPRFAMRTASRPRRAP